MAKLSSSNHGMNLYQGRKNAIINGNFNVWQRGTGFSSIANNTYTADRFQYAKSGAMVHDVARDTDVPSSVNANYSMKIDCTTADASIGATDLCGIHHRIEGYNFLPFVGKTATLSFWVKATKTGTYCIAFANSGADRSYVAEYTINSASTWEKKTITLTFDYSGGTWDYTNDVGLQMSWILASGSNYQTTADVWQSGNYNKTSNQVNGCDNIDNNFWIAQVQLELGAEATEFEHLPIDQEILMCKRYYDTDGGNNGSTWRGYIESGMNFTFMIYFSTNMRIAPTITSSSVTATNFPSTDPSFGNTSFKQAEVTKQANGTGEGIFTFRWAADAEL